MRLKGRLPLLAAVRPKVVDSSFNIAPDVSGILCLVLVL